MKRKNWHLTILVIMILSLMMVTGCTDLSSLAGSASITENDEVQTEEYQMEEQEPEIDQIIQGIDEIEEVTLDSKDQIESLRERYDNLSDTEKEAIINYDILLEAEEVYQTLVKEQEDEESKLNCTVWLTKTGNCYHLESCWHLKSKKESLTQKEAIDRGIAPCKDCITSFWLPKYKKEN